MSDTGLSTHTDTLTRMYCNSCGLSYAVPECWRAGKQKTGSRWTCPNGCNRVYCESDADRLQKELQRERARHDQCDARLRDERKAHERTERRRAASVGAHTKTKKRIAKGVCPCCKRCFTNLRKHMEGQHPDYANSET